MLVHGEDVVPLVVEELKQDQSFVKGAMAPLYLTVIVPAQNQQPLKAALLACVHNQHQQHQHVVVYL
jgi:hypothetical protein